MHAIKTTIVSNWINNKNNATHLKHQALIPTNKPQQMFTFKIPMPEIETEIYKYS
jgi:hypothetical protein